MPASIVVFSAVPAAGDDAAAAVIRALGAEAIPVTADRGWDAAVAAAMAPVAAGVPVLVRGAPPAGVAPVRVGELADAVRDAGGVVLADVTGPALRAALLAGVHLARLDAGALEQVADAPPPDAARRRDAAADLVAEGAADGVVLAGPDGLELVTAAGPVRIAGDDAPGLAAPDAAGLMMGAAATAIAWGWEPADALRLGVAAVAAAGAGDVPPGREGILAEYRRRAGARARVPPPV